MNDKDGAGKGFSVEIYHYLRRKKRLKVIMKNVMESTIFREKSVEGRIQDTYWPRKSSRILTREVTSVRRGVMV